MNALQDVKNKTPLDQHRTNTSSPRQSVRMTPASSNSSLKSSSTSSSKASSSSAAGSSTLSSGSIQSSDKLDKPANGRPHSHHRRKSSVSTRRESQEIITGVATAEDEETLGSRDEIRKRALLALEGGRNVMSGFSRVEIPEWKTPSAENKTFDWDPASLNNLSFGTNSLAGKRDSFGRSLAHASISTKIELSTLVEEEEEDEENANKQVPSPERKGMAPTTQLTAPTPHPRPRPASLTLRHLSLVGDLPSPVSTPSPRNSSSSTSVGMRPLTLAPSLFTTPSPSVATNRSSLSSISSSSPSSPSPVTLPSSGSSAAARRQSRLSYRKSSESQPLTPSSVDSPSPPRPVVSVTGQHLKTPQSSISSTHLTHSSRFSQQSMSGAAERPFSPTEIFAQQTYSIQAHASLLDRIATLEDALSKAQKDSSSSSATASASSPTSPSSSEEELIALVADLKSSRDTLHSKATFAEAKVAELERTVDLVRGRLENARQEAWSASDRADVLRLECDGLRGEIGELRGEKAGWEKDQAAWKAERASLKARMEELILERDDARKQLSEVETKLSSLPTPSRTPSPLTPSSTTALRRGNMSASSVTTTATVVDANEDGFDANFRMPLMSGAQPFKFKHQAEPSLDALEEEDNEDDSGNYASVASKFDADSSADVSVSSLQAGFAANFAASYSDEEDNDAADDDEESNGLSSYENEPASFADFAEGVMSDNDELMDDFDDDDDDLDEPEQECANQDALVTPVVHQHERQSSQSHSRKESRVVNWRFPAPVAGLKSRPFTPSSSTEDEDDEMDDFDDAPRVALIATGTTPRKVTKKSATRVEVTPQLANAFIANFALDDDEGFSWGSDGFSAPEAPKPSVPSCPTALPQESSLRKLPSIAAPPPKASQAAPARTATPPAVVVTAATPPAATATSKPKPRVLATGRPKVTPPPFIPPPPTFAAAPASSSLPTPPSSSSITPAKLLPPGSLSSSVSSTSSYNEDDTFSYSFSESSGARPSTPDSNTDDINVVSFPTTSASPFKMQVSPPTPASPLAQSVASSIGSTIASFLPWGGRSATPPAASTSFAPVSRTMTPPPPVSSLGRSPSTSSSYSSYSTASSTSYTSSPLSPKAPATAPATRAAPNMTAVLAEDLQRPAPPRAPQRTGSAGGARGQVSPEVMRERLRARLMQEGRAPKPPMQVPSSPFR